MNRRQVVTGLGSLAVMGGTVLALGAFDATISTARASMAVTTRGADASLAVRVGDGADEGNVRRGLLSDAELQALTLEDLPLAAVENHDDSMVNLQVIGIVGERTAFEDIINIVNYGATDYDAGFIYDGGFVEQTTEPTDTSENNLSHDAVASVFQFDQGGQTISGVDVPEQFVAVPGGVTITDIDLEFDGTVSELETEFETEAGAFGEGEAETTHFIDRVTAVANERQSP